MCSWKQLILYHLFFAFYDFTFEVVLGLDSRLRGNDGGEYLRLLLCNVFHLSFARE
jgi:hypothetical protein